MNRKVFATLSAVFVTSVLCASPGLCKEDFKSFMKRGNELLRKYKYAEALPYFEQALTMKPDDPNALTCLAECETLLHHGSDAIKHIAVIRLLNSTKRTRAGRIYWSLARFGIPLSSAPLSLQVDSGEANANSGISSFSDFADFYAFCLASSERGGCRHLQS